jgi:hypothetical protein
MVPVSVDSGSTRQVILHSVCHRELHHNFTNAELAKHKNTKAKLRGLKPLLRPFSSKTGVVNGVTEQEHMRRTLAESLAAQRKNLFWGFNLPCAVCKTPSNFNGMNGRYYGYDRFPRGKKRPKRLPRFI